MATRTAARPVADRADLSVILTAIALLIIGLVMSLSASSIRSVESTGSAFTQFARQFAWAAIGCGALLFGARFDYRKLKGVGYALVPAVWVLLLITVVAGEQIGGASRWLAVGPLSLQPSEIAKLALIVFGADILMRKQDRIGDLKHLIVPFLGVVFVTALLIMMQPDFGTTVIVVAIALMMAYVAGADLRHLTGIVAVGAIVAVPVMLGASYRRARLFSFLSGGEDCLNTSYQTCQGLVALGSGKWFGLGLGSSRQKYRYLPNPDTDFIFAIIGEETGLVGTLTVLLLFAMLAVFGIRAARRAPDTFGFLIASGVTAWITLQALINVCTVTGLLPITGVPLPLISVGGTSLFVSLAGLGLVASVGRRGQRTRRRA